MEMVKKAMVSSDMRASAKILRKSLKKLPQYIFIFKIEHKLQEKMAEIHAKYIIKENNPFFVRFCLHILLQTVVRH